MLPSASLIRFIVCETARDERDGKVSLIGVFPDDKVVLPANAQFPAGFALSLVFFLLDGLGPFTGRIEIRHPRQPSFFGDLPGIQKLPSNCGTVIVNFTPFIAHEFGRYDAILTLTDTTARTETYTKSFEVAAAQPAVQS